MSDEKTLEETVDDFLRRNIPQIRMHGGSAAIHTDEDEGIVHITLGGACTGCGLKPMTMKAIKRQLLERLPEVTDVRISTQGAQSTGPQSSSLSPSSESETDTSDAPF